MITYINHSVVLKNLNIMIVMQCIMRLEKLTCKNRVIEKLNSQAIKTTQLLSNIIWFEIYMNKRTYFYMNWPARLFDFALSFISVFLMTSSEMPFCVFCR